LFYEPKGRGTDPAEALRYLNRIITRRSVVFLISDFQAPDFSREVAITARRHDLIAVPIVDPREEELPEVGWLTLEDAETGEQIEINTGDRSTRLRFVQQVDALTEARMKNFRQRRVDTITLRTNEDYVPVLRNFFRTRERRLMMRA
jgi:uncharacterized protein (DUF58 family)